LQFVASKVPEGMPAQVILAFFHCSITSRMPGGVQMFFRLPHAGYEEHFRRCREIAVWNDGLAGIICQRRW
jgi:hypothetical protein